MILSKVDLINSKYLYISQLIKLINLFNKVYSNKLIVMLKTTKNKDYFLKFQAPKVNYIITITLSKTNSIVNVSDVDGNVKISISSGFLNFKKYQKKHQPSALLNIFQLLFLKAKFLQNKTVALHFKNVKRFYETFFITALKTKFFIKVFQSYNLTPHNGCRPKKLKKNKFRTKRRLTKKI